jgi:hypothetical protein
MPNKKERWYWRNNVRLKWYIYGPEEVYLLRSIYIGCSRLTLG